jgi:hypothetical protein
MAELGDVFRRSLRPSAFGADGQSRSRESQEIAT